MSLPQPISLSRSTSREARVMALRGHEVRGKATTRIVRALLWLSLLGFASPARAQYSEHEVKAALLLNFARYVTWPVGTFENADTPLTICILGDNQVASQIEKVVKGQHAGARSINVQRIDSASSVKPCQMLFVGKGQATQLNALSKRAGAACLTVSDADDFLRHGGTIRFYLSTDNKVRFEINPRAVTRQQLKPSAALLRLARIASDGR